jgi:sugar lactone lactonase YvrE
MKKMNAIPAILFVFILFALPACNDNSLSASTNNQPAQSEVSSTQPIPVQATVEPMNDSDSRDSEKGKSKIFLGRFSLPGTPVDMGREKFVGNEIKEKKDLLNYFSPERFEEILSALNSSPCGQGKLSIFRKEGRHKQLILSDGCNAEYPAIISVNDTRVKIIDLSSYQFMYESGIITAITDINNNGEVEFWLEGTIAECEPVDEEKCESQGSIIVEETERTEEQNALFEISTDGIGDAATFGQPVGITSDGVNLYVTDSLSHKIRKIVIVSGEVTTFAGSGDKGALDGKASEASFDSPSGITTDGRNLYVADTVNHKIRKIEIASGVVTSFAGSGAMGSLDASGVASSFNYPFGLTTDGSSLFVADTSNHKIRKIALTTGKVTTLAGSGVAGDRDAIGVASSFGNPLGIAIDGVYLYVTDTTNNRIRKVHLETGEVTTLAGSSQIGSKDGLGQAATFSNPDGIATDGHYLYVTEYLNNRIRKIEINTGVVTTIAGNGTKGSEDAVGGSATFSVPDGIASVGSNLYVADSGNKRIRKIDVATQAVTTIAGH